MDAAQQDQSAPNIDNAYAVHAFRAGDYLDRPSTVRCFFSVSEAAQKAEEMRTEGFVFIDITAPPFPTEDGYFSDTVWEWRCEDFTWDLFAEDDE